MSLRRRCAVSLALLAAIAGCTGESSEPPTEPPTGNGVVSLVDDAEQADLLLYVSNQSFEDEVVGITVAIDGVVVVDQDFDVEGQHNWVEFPIALPAGEHTVTATSGTGAEGSQELTLPEGEQRWVVVDYWYYPDQGDGSDVVERTFTIEVSDEQVGFA